MRHLNIHILNKTYIRTILFALFLSVSFAPSAQIIKTIAGIDTSGYFGDGGPATSAELNFPIAVLPDASKNIYIADFKNNRIRIINSSGTINTFAGNGVQGYSGDGGTATNAEFYKPIGLARDISGNIYIADHGNNRIRIINSSGIVNTLAGNGIAGYSGDGGPATSAELDMPTCVTWIASGKIYIADYQNNRIRMVNTSGIITTIAGNGFGAPSSGGYSGDGGQATAAELYNPSVAALDTSGNLYISDYMNNRVRVIDTSGIITTLAGNGIGNYSGDGGPATAAELNPSGLTLDASGNIYIPDYGNNRIRMINTSGIISTSAGNGIPGFSGDGGPATAAEINGPSGLAFDVSGNLYIADFYNQRVREVLSNSTSIDQLIRASGEITIYPVPNTGSFTVSGITQGQVIDLYNSTGQKILSTISPAHSGPSANFDISNQPNGIYLLRILNKDGSVVAVKKILKTE